MDARLREAVYRAVDRVPEGTVATYGQIAAQVGIGPRQVGRALREMPEARACPWHRVVNARGQISLRSRSDGHLRQRRLLEAEGISFGDGRIDLGVYRWEPD